MSRMSIKTDRALPEFFRPLFWSSDFSSVDAVEDEEQIIIKTINYGDLRHWRWIIRFYGKKTIREVLEKVPISEIRPRVRKLASIIFSIKDFNYAPRGTH